MLRRMFMMLQFNVNHAACTKHVTFRIWFWISTVTVIRNFPTILYSFYRALSRQYIFHKNLWRYFYYDMRALCRSAPNELSRSTETLHAQWLAISSLWNTNHDWAPSHVPALIISRKSMLTRLDVNKPVFPCDVGQEYSDALCYHINLVRKVADIFPLLTLPRIASNMLQTYVLTLNQNLECRFVDKAATQCMKNILRLAT